MMCLLVLAWVLPRVTPQRCDSSGGGLDIHPQFLVLGAGNAEA
jgi:hypothetical protein